MQKFNVAVCDDDSNQITTLKAYIESWAHKNEVSISIDSFESAENFIFEWESPASYDLLFLDIQMKKMSGIELAEYIRTKDTNMAIVFVTADRDHVFKGYDVEALYYLVKPISEEDVEKCLVRAWKGLKKDETGVLLVNHEGSLVRIDLSDLLYAESQTHYITLNTTKGQYRYRKKIADLEQEIAGNNNIVRVHRSCIVNLAFVSALEKNDLVLDDGRRLPVSRKYLKETRTAFVRRYAAG